MTKSREWFQDESLTDAQLLSRCNEEFRRGPIGLWSTLGDELWMISGMTVVFAPAGEGTVHFWDLNEDESYEVKDNFRWECAGDFEIDLEPIRATNPANRWGRIRFEIRVERNEYRNRSVRIVEVETPDQIGQEPNFWWSIRPLNLLSLDASIENPATEDV
jgi:hypothetical protein